MSEAVINADNKMITVHSIGCIIWIYQIIKRPRHTIPKQKSLEQLLGKRVGVEVKGFDVAKNPINRAFLKGRYFWKTVLIHF